MDTDIKPDGTRYSDDRQKPPSKLPSRAFARSRRQMARVERHRSAVPLGEKQAKRFRKLAALTGKSMYSLTIPLAGLSHRERGRVMARVVALTVKLKSSGTGRVVTIDETGLIK